MFGSFGWMELTLILIIVIIIFGAGKLPQLGEGLGKAIKGFKKSVNEPDAVDITPPHATEEPPDPAAQISQSTPSNQGAQPQGAGKTGEELPAGSPPRSS